MTDQPATVPVRITTAAVLGIVADHPTIDAARAAYATAHGEDALRALDGDCVAVSLRSHHRGVEPRPAHPVPCYYGVGVGQIDFRHDAEVGDQGLTLAVGLGADKLAAAHERVRSVLSALGLGERPICLWTVGLSSTVTVAPEPAVTNATCDAAAAAAERWFREDYDGIMDAIREAGAAADRFREATTVNPRDLEIPVNVF